MVAAAGGSCWEGGPPAEISFMVNGNQITTVCTDKFDLIWEGSYTGDCYARANVHRRHCELFESASAVRTILVMVQGGEINSPQYAENSLK